VPVEELHATGWLHAVVSETELGATADTIAEGLAARAGNAGSALKQLLARIEGVPADNALRLELEAFAENWRTGAPADALRDFLDRRPTAATEAPR
jgi:hypothetical protein